MPNTGAAGLLQPGTGQSCLGRRRTGVAPRNANLGGRPRRLGSAPPPTAAITICRARLVASASTAETKRPTTSSTMVRMLDSGEAVLGICEPHGRIGFFVRKVKTKFQRKQPELVGSYGYGRPLVTRGPGGSSWLLSIILPFCNHPAFALARCSLLGRLLGRFLLGSCRSLPFLACISQLCFGNATLTPCPLRRPKTMLLRCLSGSFLSAGRSRNRSCPRTGDRVDCRTGEATEYA
jgi:hypothetical protein